MPARALDRAVMFVGPTMATRPHLRRLARRFTLRRPVRRHDVAKLVEGTRRPGVIVLVDGVFQDTLAVGHAEIRAALERGWRVWGLSSMGAIRAREMAHLGMRGFGEVFERFCGDDDFQDDEVALLHEATPPFRPVSEPLVHLRAAIAHLVARGVVGDDDAREVLADLKHRWYGERTLRRATHLLAKRAPGGGGAVGRELDGFERFRVKGRDLERFVREWADDRQ